MKLYNLLTREERIELFVKTRGCSICKGKSGATRRVVDHCHRTGFVREVICEKCNSWLGVVEGKRSAAGKVKFMERVNKKYKIPMSRFTAYLRKYDNLLTNHVVQSTFVPVISVEI